MILQIAGGVVLGGVTLYLLYVFMEPVVKAIMWALGIAAALGILWLVVEFLIGGWHFVNLLIWHRGVPFHTLPDRIFKIAIELVVCFLFFAAWSEVADGFPWSRDAIQVLRQRFAGRRTKTP